MARKGMPKGKKGHQAHLSMGLPKGNPMAGGGNYGRRTARGGGARRVSAGGRRRTSSY
jgi:hypothetical protein